MANASYGPTFDQTVTTLFFVTLAAAACLIPLQNDTWWHLRTGEEIWRRGSVILRDEFSFTAAGAYWPNHEWLGGLVFYLVYSIGGLPLLTLFTAACLTAAIAMSWRLMTGPPLLRLILMGLGISSLAFVWTVRPHVFTQVMLMLTVHLCIRRALWILPPMFALWANLHGGVALGFIVLGAALIADAWLAGLRKTVDLFLIIAACFAATMLTPLGFDLWPTIPESINKSVSNGISEWKPPFLGWRDLGFWLIAIVFVPKLIRSWRTIVKYDDALLAALAILLLPFAVRHSRNVTPFVLVALPAISRILELPAFLTRTSRRDNRILNAALIGACALGAVAVVGLGWSEPAARLQWNPVSPGVVQAIRHCPGRLYNRYDDGGYVIWFARVPVYADSRQDPYPLEFLQEHRRHEMSGEYATVFEKYDVRCAFLPPVSATAQRLLQDGWRVAASDQRWLVLYPAGAVRPDPQDSLDLPPVTGRRLSR